MCRRGCRNAAKRIILLRRERLPRAQARGARIAGADSRSSSWERRRQAVAQSLDGVFAAVPAGQP